MKLFWLLSRGSRVLSIDPDRSHKTSILSITSSGGIEGLGPGFIENGTETGRNILIGALSMPPALAQSFNKRSSS